MEAELQKKIMDSFMGKVVRKDLAFLVKGNLPVPTYVLEYLLSQYCASDDQAQIEAGLEKVKDIITKNYVQRQDSERVKSLINLNGKYRIIDKISVVLNDKADEYQANFANLGLTGIPIGSQYIRQNPKLLSGNGVWCIITVGYIPGENIRMHWEIQQLKPIQISSVDVRDYIEHRKNFTTEEWIDFMIHTIGLNPDLLNRREKLIAICRLLPHVENNFNFMELGPKGTGKSHVFQELSPFGVLVSGGDVTSARLFSKISGNKEIMGLVGFWDVVAWDEYEQQKGRAVDAVLIDTMQNYLANKSFNRGKASHEAAASMCFVGNTKHTVPHMLKNSHLFESIPTAFIKGAFLDRIHLYNPGWEVKILKKESFSRDYGMITDYIAAILHELRQFDFSPRLREFADFSKTLSERDHNAIRKTFSGLIKLLYPDGVLTDEEAYEIIDFAAESRKRVKDQLYIIDDTFRAAGVAEFKYTKPDGTEVFVETLERQENPEIVIEPSLDDIEAGTAGSTPEKTGPAVPPKKDPEPHHHDIRENLRGVSYESIFADYMKGASKAIIIDPYLRNYRQIDNLVDFIRLFIERADSMEDLSIELHTKDEYLEEFDNQIEKMKSAFEEIEQDLATYNVEFKVIYDATHDRCVMFDNGWRINLGKGLDIYGPFDRFSLAKGRQELRRCKAFGITYLKQ